MKKLSMLVVLVAALALAACGGSSSNGNGDTGLNNAQTVTGTVLSASGDPVPATTVYLPGVTVSAQYAKATRDFSKSVTAADGTVCEDPLAADSSLVAACTAADGTFNMDTSALTTNPTQVVFQRGSLRMIQDLSCSADPCALDSATTTFGGGTTVWPVIAAVTGLYDRMEDVLAKLADSDTTDSTNGSYGRVDSTTGYFVYGSEYGTNLTIINGTGYTTPTENVDSVTYKTWDTYLDGTNPLVSGGVPVYDVVFINCGNQYEATLTDAAVRGRLDAYVEAGGRLYVTDLAYDHLEQPFPEFMQYEGDPADPTTPGAMGAAELGTDGVWVNGAVNEAGMTYWLGTVAVNGADATTPGNPNYPADDGNCSGAMTYDQVTGALLASGLIPLGDFLGGWAQMVGPHTGYSPTIWISSGAGVVFDGQADRPLTTSLAVGSSGGALLYSSYHTAHSCPTPTFWPQERVLQYLMFEAF